MAALVNLANAKAHLNEIDEAHNIDIQQKVEHASDLVMARVNGTAYWRAITTTWTEATVPGEVQAAILSVLAFLWDHRGDGLLPDEKFWRAIDCVIASKKDPVIA